MTRQEAVTTLAMIADNWTFLKALHEVESNSFEIFYVALAPYPVQEVQQGIRNAIRELKKTPVVADIVEYVEDVRRGNRREADDVNVRQMFNDAVRCKECNDHGFKTIVYPSGDEAIRPCDCVTGHLMFGDNAFKLNEMDMPRWKQDIYFNGRNPREFKLVRASRRTVPTREKYKGSDGAMHDKMRIVYVEYQNMGRPKEEVYEMFVER